MATRNLLHKSHLEAFREWLKSDGWAIFDDAKGPYEVLRAKKGNRWLIVYRKADAKEHYSVRDVDYGIVRKFLRGKKNQ